ncbi:Macrophage mannose receptor 1 [Dissostichus eleginoides]|uniref:Macrophage mannose receptor 1 n=1 Tax=Dissostichus eleginoides TaxID=100907 RepID=A0AAD9B918_DISEL|nr:Macrophage mannose receptor 1 [Dissostichus eleginoides]
MDQTSTLVLFLLSLSATLGKYVYIEQRKSWFEALAYCQQYHTDLAPVRYKSEINHLMKLANYSTKYMWIGLIRNPTDADKWTWSGGAEVSTFFWANGQPNKHLNEDHGCIKNYSWHDAAPHYELNFFCFTVVVVRERKTWQEALEYCREHHRDLASVSSDTEMLLIQRELQERETTERVWTGLRFFPGGWLWVDGRGLSYEAWGQEGKPECPEVKRHCAALQVMAGTPSIPFEFHSYASAGTVHTNNTWSYGVNTAGEQGKSFIPEIDEAADVKEGVWEAHDCEERLHFLCY